MLHGDLLRGVVLLRSPLLAGAPSEAVKTQVLPVMQLGQLPHVKAANATRGLNVATNTQAPFLVHFGQFPVVIFEHGDKTYVHQTQDPAQFEKVLSKKAQKRASAKAKKQRRPDARGASSLEEVRGGGDEG